MRAILRRRCPVACLHARPWLGWLGWLGQLGWLVSLAWVVVSAPACDDEPTVVLGRLTSTPTGADAGSSSVAGPDEREHEQAERAREQAEHDAIEAQLARQQRTPDAGLQPADGGAALPSTADTQDEASGAADAGPGADAATLTDAGAAARDADRGEAMSSSEGGRGDADDAHDQE